MGNNFIDRMDGDPSEPGLVNVTIEQHLIDKIGEDGEKIIRSTVNAYTAMYGSPIKDLFIGLGHWQNEKIQLPDGRFILQNILEEAYPGRIYIDPDNLTGNLLVRLRDIIAHSCTHSFQPATPSDFLPLMKLDDGNKVYGVQGLSLIIEPYNSGIALDGYVNQFSKIEETIAELLALQLLVNKRIGYTSFHPNYFNLGNFALTLHNSINMGNPDFREIAGFVQTNNIHAFTAYLLGKNVARYRDIEFIMEIHNEAFGGGNHNDLVKRVLAKRGSK